MYKYRNVSVYIALEHSYTVDLVGLIRKRRLKYVGHVLRREEGYLVRQVLLIKLQNELRDGRSRSSILMDVPDYVNVEEVVEMARDKENWQLEANALQRKPRTDISLVSNTYNISRLNTNTTITHSYNLRTRKCRT